MSDLDDFLGGGDKGFEESEWHNWESHNNEDGSPKMEKQVIWDKAKGEEVETYLTCFKPLKGIFTKTFIFTSKKYGNEQIGFQVRVEDQLIQFATGSKIFGMQIQKLDPQAGDLVRVNKWGEMARTKYLLEVVVPVDAAANASQVDLVEKVFKNDAPTNVPGGDEVPF